MRLIGAAVLIALALGWASGGSAPPRSSSDITDVSWPNCGLNLAAAQAGIVGVTGGLALRPNPCLSKEAANYKNLSVYVNTGYPGLNIASKFQIAPKNCSANDKQCRAYNYGYSNGLFAIKYSLMSGVVAKQWWLDVETENSWDNSIWVNRASLQGTYDAITRFAGKENVGYYSYPGQWDLLTGKWRNGISAWVATGSSRRDDALAACTESSFTGGKVKLTQYTLGLDHNVDCSGVNLVNLGF